MFRRIVDKIRSPFWLTFALGISSLGLLFRDLGARIPKFSSYLLFGFFIGLALGIAAFIIERSLYFRYSRQQGGNTIYKTTSTPKFLLLLLTGFLMFIDSEENIGNSIAIVMAISSYLITLSIIIFLMRGNRQIIIT
jgi:hypothetical protein